MLCYIVFFFKQKTAYEMLRSLVGSEMCIRDSVGELGGNKSGGNSVDGDGAAGYLAGQALGKAYDAVSYTHLTLPTLYSV